MLRRTILTAFAVASLSLSAGAFIAPAMAQTAATKALVDAAKAAGTVGEQSDGLLGFVSGGGDAATRAAVAEINAGRSQVYREAAAKSGASAEAAGASAFTNVIQGRLKAGEYYKNASGAWVRK